VTGCRVGVPSQHTKAAASRYAGALAAITAQSSDLSARAIGQTLQVLGSVTGAKSPRALTRSASTAMTTVASNLLVAASVAASSEVQTGPGSGTRRLQRGGDNAAAAAASQAATSSVVLDVLSNISRRVSARQVPGEYPEMLSTAGFDMEVRMPCEIDYRLA
jgi:hypothetical protein